MQSTLRPALKPLQWAPVGLVIIAKQEALESRRLKRCCYRVWEYAQKPAYQKLRSSGRQRLESYERALRFYFTHGKMKLGPMQNKLIQVYTIAALQKFFKTDLVANLRYLSKKYLIDTLNNAIAVLYPRRAGKTEGTTLFVAVCTVSQPDWNSVIFNLTNRQAREALQATIKHMEVFRNDSEFGFSVEQQDQRQYIVIRNKKYGTLNSVKSYPCALKASDANIGARPVRRFTRPGGKRLGHLTATTTTTHTHTATTSFIHFILTFGLTL